MTAEEWEALEADPRVTISASASWLNADENDQERSS